MFHILLRYIDCLVQERRSNSIANRRALRHSCTNPWLWDKCEKKNISGLHKTPNISITNTLTQFCTNQVIKMQLKTIDGQDETVFAKCLYFLGQCGYSLWGYYFIYWLLLDSASRATLWIPRWGLGSYSQLSLTATNRYEYCAVIESYLMSRGTVLLYWQSS